MKKLLSILLCAAMLCTVSFTAFAEDNNTMDAVISVGTVKGQPGESVVVPVSIEKNPGFGALSLTVSYDSSMLSVTDEKVTPGNVIKGAVNTADGSKAIYLVNTDEAGKIYISLIKSENITTDGVLFNIEFKAAKDADEETEIILSVDEMADESASVYTGHTAEKGSVSFASAVKYGDVNMDGYVKVEDALTALQGAVGKITLTDAQTKAADVDGDPGVSVNDALTILQYAVGKITVFPIEAK